MGFELPIAGGSPPVRNKVQRENDQNNGARRYISFGFESVEMKGEAGGKPTMNIGKKKKKRKKEKRNQKRNETLLVNREL